MDDIARGIATAALTLQSAMLQGLIANGVMTPAAALDVVDKALAASIGRATSKAERDVALVTVEALEWGGVKETFRADLDSPDLDPGDEYVGQSGAEPRSGPFRGQRLGGAAMAVLAGADRRCADCGFCLQAAAAG